MKNTIKALLALMVLTITLTLSACGFKPEEVTYKPDDLTKMVYDVPKEKHFDSEGNLLVTYDIAYKALFDTGEVKYDETAVLIKMSSKFDGVLNKNLKNAGLKALNLTTNNGNVSWYRGLIKDDLNIKDVMAKLREMPEVLVADYDYIYETEAITNTEVLENERIGEQWYLDRYGIQDAWTWLSENGHQAGGSSSVVVAVIDTGVDYTHPDLAQNMWVNPQEIPNNGIDDDGNGFVDDIHGVNVVSDDRFHSGNPMDDHGHGTHVAGIIAADNNKEGIVGIAYNTKIMAIKAGQGSGYFTQASIAAGIMYAYEHGADVINMSFGGSSISIAVQDALMTAYTRSVLVSSAGNSGLPNEFVPGWLAVPNYPAALPYVVGVMSVDEFNFESAFTNWDVKPFNSSEYEVYAPGEQILSTLPNGKYAKWSGTSMAAPIVSGVAALVRSVYQDRNMYPNKFVMGQLVSTSETVGLCNNPLFHGIHNRPMVIDAYKALTVTPKPAITLYDYFVFDDVSISDKNNGDGVIDAGETIDIGLVLRNRWGMSKDTIVTLNATSDGGVDNGFIEFITNDINYQGVGTYSTKDTLRRDQMGIVTGVDNPFRIKIADNTPNDYVIKINVLADYMNALDTEDLTHYGLPPYTAIELTVRNGYVLPNIIDEDMILTKDNYYIIPNSTLITKNATVTVEPGTNIQFWTNDPEDPYADVAITYLRVEGRFITQGTAEEPVKIFPSELMAHYKVEIYERNNGLVSLSYTEVTNPALTISYMNYGKVIQNFNEPLYYRYLSSGVIYTSTVNPFISIKHAENSIFYGLGGGYYADLYGSYFNSIFSENMINFNSNAIFENTVFLNNNNHRHNGNSSSSLAISAIPTLKSVNNIVYIEELDTYYVMVETPWIENSFYQRYIHTNFAKYLGGDLAQFETEQEFNLFRSNSSMSGLIGLAKNPMNQQYEWINGTPLNSSIVLKNTEDTSSSYYAYYANNEFYMNNNSSTMIFEFKGSSYIENITLQDEQITMDLEATYQLEPYLIRGSQDLSTLIYSTDDPGVATVNSQGLIEPKSIGTAYIYVSAPDYGDYTVVKVIVKEKVNLIDFTVNEITQMNKGEEKSLQPILTPYNTTQSALIFSSSDDNVVSVTQNGRLIARNVGVATITVSSSNIDKIISMDVQVVTPITSIDFRDSIYLTTLDTTTDNLGLKVNPIDASTSSIVYESSNPTVAYIDETGKLVKLTKGTTTVRAYVKGLNISDEITISVQDAVVQSKVIEIEQYDRWFFTLNEQGEIYAIGSGFITPDYVPIPDNGSIIDFGIFNGYLIVVYEDGSVKQFNISSYLNNKDNNIYTTNEKGVNTITNVTKVEVTGNSAHFLKNDGSVWGVGYNSYGEIGDASNAQRYQPVQTLINNVVDIETNDTSVIYLTVNGDAYITGSEQRYIEPKLIHSNVISIDGGRGLNYINVRTSSRTYLYYHYGYVYQETTNLGQKVFTHYSRTMYINNGSVYVQGENNYGQLGVGSTNYVYGYQKVTDLENVEHIFMFSNNTFFVTSDGYLYAAGENSNGQLSDFTTKASNVAKKIIFGVSSLNLQLELESTNLVNNQLFDDSISLNYNDAIGALPNYAYIALKDSNNTVLSVTKTLLLDKLTIKPFTKLTVGSTYILEIPSNAIGTKFGVELPATTYTFVYKGQQIPIQLLEQSITEGQNLEEGQQSFVFKYSYANASTEFNNIQIKDGNGQVITSTIQFVNSTLKVDASLVEGSYTLTIPVNALSDNLGNQNELVEIHFDVIKVLQLVEFSHQNSALRYDIEASIIYTFSDSQPSTNFADIKLLNSLKQAVPSNITMVNNQLVIDPIENLIAGEVYVVSLPENAIIDLAGNFNQVMNHEFRTYEPLKLIRTTFENQSVHLTQTLKVVYNYIETSTNYEAIILVNQDDLAVEIDKQVIDGQLLVTPIIPLSENETYSLIIPEAAFKDEKGIINQTLMVDFTTIDIIPRDEMNSEFIMASWRSYIDSGEATRIRNSAFLNPFINPNLTSWFRVNAENSPESSDYENKAGLSGNYWGTTDKTFINKQILDFDDYQSLINVIEGRVLEVAPENTFPFVTSVVVYNAAGEISNVVGNETITVLVKFNRDMNTDINLDVRFGSSLPYAEYQILGTYINPRTWQGTYTLTTIIENGNQFFNIQNGHALGNSWYKLMPDVTRFGFEIDTTAAQALTMQAEPTTEGIELTWEQDDFDTLAGYNVYRSEQEDGYYQRLNNLLIPYDVKTFFDPNVIPGVVYYYNFTVIKTDLTESYPSGKVSVMSLDTMAPTLYHSPIYETFLNNNLVITAQANDNVRVISAKVFYRTSGQSTYESIEMNMSNNKYTAVIGANNVLIEGLEYYIVASDGLNNTYKGTPDNPYVVVVKSVVDSNAMGDVNGDGIITTLDALMILQAINDRLNLTSDQFQRADLDKDGMLETWEVLRVLQYVSGKVKTII